MIYCLMISKLSSEPQVPGFACMVTPMVAALLGFVSGSKKEKDNYAKTVGSAEQKSNCLELMIRNTF